MLRKKFLTGMLCSISFCSFAQAPIDSAGLSKKIFIHSMFGVQVPGFSSLNEQLEASGFNPLSAGFFSRGASLYTIFPKSRLVTFTNYQTYSGTKKSAGKENSVRGTVVGSALGFNLVRHTRAHLIPYAGLQYSWFGVRLSRSITEEQPFDDYLGAAANQYHIACNGFMGTTGVQAAFMPFNAKKPIGNALIGLRVGYFFPFGDAKWKSNNTTIDGGPKANTQGLFAGFVFGFGF